MMHNRNPDSKIHFQKTINEKFSNLNHILQLNLCSLSHSLKHFNLKALSYGFKDSELYDVFQMCSELQKPFTVDQQLRLKMLLKNAANIHSIALFVHSGFNRTYQSIFNELQRLKQKGREDQAFGWVGIDNIEDCCISIPMKKNRDPRKADIHLPLQMQSSTMTKSENPNQNKIPSSINLLFNQRKKSENENISNDGNSKTNMNGSMANKNSFFASMNSLKNSNSLGNNVFSVSPELNIDFRERNKIHSNVACKYFAISHCLNKKCYFSHDLNVRRIIFLRLKKIPCTAFLNGICQRFDSCLFLHDRRSLLKTADVMNMNIQGLVKNVFSNVGNRNQMECMPNIKLDGNCSWESNQLQPPMKSDICNNVNINMEHASSAVFNNYFVPMMNNSFKEMDDICMKKENGFSADLDIDELSDSVFDDPPNKRRKIDQAL